MGGFHACLLALRVDVDVMRRNFVRSSDAKEQKDKKGDKGGVVERMSTVQKCFKKASIIWIYNLHTTTTPSSNGGGLGT